MSLLEDVFLQDEAGEAQELERVIEGDEYDERPRPSSPDSNDNSEKEDEAEEDKRHVDPTSAKPKRIIKNPRVILNPARLTGPRGIQVIPEHFKDFKFKGKGHEKEDLDLVLKKLEHWAYRLFPKFEFKDCLKKIETLGNKRPVMVHLTKIRTDQFMSEETVVQRDSSDDEAAPKPIQEEDEFDKLLQQQIDLARATPAPGSTKKPAYSSTPTIDKSLAMPKATSSPSINDEQRDRMLRNRQLAEERRLARLKLNASETNTKTLENPTNNLVSNTTDDSTTKQTSILKTVQEITENDITDQNTNEEDIAKVNYNKSNVIDSSDEDDALVINESITVDVHERHRYDDSDVRHSDTNSRDKNTVCEDNDEIRIENDIEMNEINNKTGSRNDTMHNKNHNVVIELLNNPDNLEPHSDVSNENTKEITKNNIDPEISVSNNAMKNNSDVFNKLITKNYDSENDNIQQSKEVEKEDKKGYQRIEESDKHVGENGKQTEKVESNELEDIMDVDFGDNF